jgi:myo-inositol-hexaphosphate 3-phosphohydrolase
MGTLKKILARFVHHKVFYEMSARQRNSRQLYSVKNTFTISHFEIEGNVELLVTLFDANNAAHSVEIVNPHALRVYDENPAKGFAIVFYADEAGDFEVRYYLRDEGEDETSPKRMALEHISLPQLMEYLHESLSADVVEVGEGKRK